MEVSFVFLKKNKHFFEILKTSTLRNVTITDYNNSYGERKRVSAKNMFNS